MGSWSGDSTPSDGTVESLPFEFQRMKRNGEIGTRTPEFRSPHEPQTRR
jgi:hypothetical protein